MNVSSFYRNKAPYGRQEIYRVGMNETAGLIRLEQLCQFRHFNMHSQKWNSQHEVIGSGGGVTSLHYSAFTQLIHH